MIICKDKYENKIDKQNKQTNLAHHRDDLDIIWIKKPNDS